MAGTLDAAQRLLGSSGTEGTVEPGTSIVSPVGSMSECNRCFRLSIIGFIVSISFSFDVLLLLFLLIFMYIYNHIYICIIMCINIYI